MVRFTTGSRSQSSWNSEGIDITANRLFGPQPRTLTYACIWEIVVGNVKASLSAHQAKALLAAGNSFRLNFVDIVNSPAVEYLPPVDLDGWSKFYISELKSNTPINSYLFKIFGQGCGFDMEGRIYFNGSLSQARTQIRQQ